MAILGNLERGDEQLGTAVNPCVQMAMLGQTLEEWLGIYCMQCLRQRYRVLYTHTRVGYGSIE